MKDFRKTLGEIYREQRGLFGMMITLVIFAIATLVISLMTLSPSSAIVKVGYGDIGSFAGDDLAGMRIAGGYRDGSWASMMTFAVLSIIIGLMHNLIAVRLYKRRGSGAAKAFVGISYAVLIGVIITLLRLLGEG